MALPFTQVLAETFSRSSEAEAPEGALTWSGNYRVLVPNERWHWAASQPSKLRIVCAKLQTEPIKIPGELVWSALYEPAASWAHLRILSLRRGLCGSKRVAPIEEGDESEKKEKQGKALVLVGSGESERGGNERSEGGEGEQGAEGEQEVEGSEAEGEESNEEEEEEEDDRKGALHRAFLSWAGLGMVYTAWGVMVWIIFVYGEFQLPQFSALKSFRGRLPRDPPLHDTSTFVMALGKLIYSLYGSKTESSFVKSWGIGLAMENVTSFQEIVTESWKTFLTLLLLEIFIVGPGRWIEQHGATPLLPTEAPVLLLIVVCWLAPAASLALVVPFAVLSYGVTCAVDFLSVQSTLYGKGTTWHERARAYVLHYASNRAGG